MAEGEEQIIEEASPHPFSGYGSGQEPCEEGLDPCLRGLQEVACERREKADQQTRKKKSHLS